MQAGAQGGSERTKGEYHRRGLALAFIATPVDSTLNVVVRSRRYPSEVRTMLKRAFHSVFGAAIDEELTQLKDVRLTNGKIFVEYSSRFMGSVNELEAADDKVSNVKKRRDLLSELPNELNTTFDTIISMSDSIKDVVSKLILR